MTHPPRRRSGLGWAVLVLLALSAPAAAQELAVVPDPVVLAQAGDRVRARLYLLDAAGFPAFRARGVSWRSRSPEVAQVQQSSGWIVGVADGETWVVASSADGADSARVIVGPGAPPPPPVLALDSVRLEPLAHPDPDSVTLRVQWWGSVPSVELDLRADSGSSAGVGPGFPASGTRWVLFRGSNSTGLQELTVHRGLGFWTAAEARADTLVRHSNILEVRRAPLRAVWTEYFWPSPPDSIVQVGDTIWYRIPPPAPTLLASPVPLATTPEWSHVWPGSAGPAVSIPIGGAFCVQGRGVTWRGDTIDVETELVSMDTTVVSVQAGPPCIGARFWPR